jgi:hypothetical protein
MKPNIVFLPLLFFIGFLGLLHAGENKLPKSLMTDGAVMADSSQMMESPASINQELNMYKFNLNEESYIDDIPFNTKEIAQKVSAPADHFNLFKPVVNLRDELYIDDIPFDTKAVFEEYCVPVLENGIHYYSCTVMN